MPMMSGGRSGGGGGGGKISKAQLNNVDVELKGKLSNSVHSSLSNTISKID